MPTQAMQRQTVQGREIVLMRVPNAHRWLIGSSIDPEQKRAHRLTTHYSLWPPIGQTILSLLKMPLQCVLSRIYTCHVQFVCCTGRLSLSIISSLLYPPELIITISLSPSPSSSLFIFYLPGDSHLLSLSSGSDNRPFSHPSSSLFFLFLLLVMGILAFTSIPFPPCFLFLHRFQ